MPGFQQPFSYGSIVLPSNIFYSPLAGCSNLPFRQMSARLGRPGLQYCEMVKMEALWRAGRDTYKLLDYTFDMHPIGAQLVGADPKLAGPCAKILEDMGFDAIDLNCGCPVDKVTKDGSGSALLKNPHLVGEIIYQIVKSVRLPVSIKIRAGWDENSLNAIEIAKIAKQAGAVALTLHARTREQAYRGPANWSFIKDCKQALGDFTIIGNGDVFSALDADRMFQETGCDGIMVSRGTMGNPWLGDEITRHFMGEAPMVRTLFDALTALEAHYGLACNYLNERQAIIEMRKVSVWYLESYPSAKRLRSELAHAQTHQEVQEKLLALQTLALTGQLASSFQE